MYPARWFFRKHEEEPTTEVAIRRGFAEDLYLVMPAFERRGAEREHGDHRQPARQLGLGRLRRARHRHGHRAAAGNGVLVRARQPAGRRRDGVDAAARAGAVARRRCSAQQTVPVTQKSAAASGSSKARSCARAAAVAVGIVRHARTAPDIRRPERRSSRRFLPKARITTRSSPPS